MGDRPGYPPVHAIGDLIVIDIPVTVLCGHVGTIVGVYPAGNDGASWTFYDVLVDGTIEIFEERDVTAL